MKTILKLIWVPTFFVMLCIAGVGVVLFCACLVALLALFVAATSLLVPAGALAVMAKLMEEKKPAKVTQLHGVPNQ